MPLVDRRPILLRPSLGLDRRARRVQGDRHGQDVRPRVRGPESGEGGEGGGNGRQGEDRGAADEKVERGRVSFPFFRGRTVLTPQMPRHVPRLHQPPQMLQLQLPCLLLSAATTADQRIDRPARSLVSSIGGPRRIVTYIPHHLTRRPLRDPHHIPRHRMLGLRSLDFVLGPQRHEPSSSVSGRCVVVIV